MNICESLLEPGYSICSTHLFDFLLSFCKKKMIISDVALKNRYCWVREKSRPLASSPLKLNL